MTDAHRGGPKAPSTDTILAVRFGRFELDEATYRLTGEGQPIRVEPKPLALLFHLVRHRDRVVTQEELRQLLWPDAIVSGDSLFHVVMKAREALGERGKKDGTIQTIRGRGFRFAVEVEPIADAARAPSHGVPERPKAMRSLIGREGELKRLREIQAATNGETGRVVLVEGPAGIGKSRLVREFIEGLPPNSCEIHQATAPEAGGAPAYWLWVQILRSWLRNARENPGAAVSDIERLLSELGGSETSDTTETLDSETAQFQLIDDLARCLRDHARERPLLLALEDLQWIDAGSAKALAFLADTIATAPILIVGTCRDVELGPDHPLEPARVEWIRRDLLEVVPLVGLDPDEITTLVADVTGYEADDGFIEALWSRTQGNPFFVRQILALALARSDPTEKLDERLRSEVGTIPHEVRRVIRGRLARLDGPTQMVLSCAAAFGPEFGLAALARCVDLDRAALLRALERASTEQIIAPRATLELPYSFTHGLLQEVAYAELDATERAQVHHRIAAALEELHADHLEPVVPALARHYLEAAPLLEGDEAVRYAKWSGDLARDGRAYKEAAEHYGRALRALDLLPNPSTERRAELAVLRGFALQTSGRHEEGRQVLHEALGVARDAGLKNLMVAAAVGFAEYGLGLSDLAAVDALEQARDALEKPEGMLHVWVYALLATNLANERDRLDEAHALSMEAEEIANRLGEPGAQSLALSSRAAVQRLHPAGQPAERADVAARAAAHAAEARDPNAELIARIQRFGALLEQGDISAVDAEGVQLDQVLQKLRSPYWEYVRPSLQAMRALLDGHFDAAERLALEAYQGTEHPRLNLAAALAGMIASIRHQQGRLEELIPALDAIVSQDPKIPALRTAAVGALLEAGREEQARDELHRIAADGFDSIVGTESWLCSLAMLAEVAARVGDEQQICASLFEILEPRSEQCIIIANGHYCHGPVTLYLGMLATALERGAEAEQYLEDALERSERLRSPVWRAQTLAATARLGRASGNRSLGQAARKETLAIAKALGMAALVREFAG